MASSSVWFVYILRCADDSLYIGPTQDLDSPLIKHHDEGSASRFIAAGRPVTLLYSETYRTRDGALQRERQLKGAPSLLQLDGDSVGRLSGSVLFRVLRCAGHADVVRLRVWLVIQVDDHPVQDVLVRLALLMSVVVDAKDAHVFVLERDFVVLGIDLRRIQWSFRCFACRRAFQVDLENANRVIADVLGDVGAARQPPANIAAAKFDPGGLPAQLARGLARWSIYIGDGWIDRAQ